MSPTAPSLLPGPVPRPAEDDTGGRRYLASYLLMRVVIGVLGIALPVVLVLGDRVLTGSVPWRGSLSAYYYSGGGDLFVGAMVATGLFLLTYRAFERSWENVLSFVAGVAALGVALFPTGGGDRDTQLQIALGEGTVAALHYVSACLFIGSLAIISFIFGRREGARPGVPDVKARRWRNTHYAFGVIILLAVAHIVLGALGLLGSGSLGASSLFVGEVVAVVAFGLSWLLKGTELRKLHLRDLGLPVAVTAVGTPAAEVFTPQEEVDIRDRAPNVPKARPRPPQQARQPQPPQGD